MASQFKIVVKHVEKPFTSSLDKELDWICNSFGFFRPIDGGTTAASIFREIVIATEREKPVTSTELSQHVRMSRGAVINHLNNLLRAGLIVKQGRRHESRSRSMLRTIEEIEEDVTRIFQHLKKTARSIDREFGIEQ